MYHFADNLRLETGYTKRQMDFILDSLKLHRTPFITQRTMTLHSGAKFLQSLQTYRYLSAQLSIGLGQMEKGNT
jgi:hypothetical protein